MQYLVHPPDLPSRKHFCEHGYCLQGKCFEVSFVFGQFWYFTVRVSIQALCVIVMLGAVCAATPTHIGWVWCLVYFQSHVFNPISLFIYGDIQPLGQIDLKQHFHNIVALFRVNHFESSCRDSLKKSLYAYIFL